MVFLGSSIRLKVTWRDIDDSLLTPDTQEWKLYDSAGTLQLTETSPSLETEGVYYTDHNILSTDPTGIWKLVPTAVKDTRLGVATFFFDVEAP